MRDFAIYTAITGSYDQIRQPLIIDDRFDYYLFSNNVVEKQIGVWQVCPIPYHNDTQIKIARWVKTHPEKLLPNYKFTLWIDGNIRIISSFPYKHAIELFQAKQTVAAIKHPYRKCIYNEAYECAIEGIEDETTIYKWLHKLIKEKYPQNNGLFETGILYRINNDISKELDKLWWECIKQYSKRDQLSFNYSLWKIQTECALFLPESENIRNTIHFDRDTEHINTPNRASTLSKNNSSFLYWYLKETSAPTNPPQIFFHICRSSNPMLAAKIVGYYFRLKKRVHSI